METLVPTYKTKQCHNPEGHSLNTHHYKKLKMFQSTNASWYSRNTAMTYIMICLYES